MRVRGDFMNKFYSIGDNTGLKFGYVENKKDVAPFIILNKVLLLDDSVDNDVSLIDLFENRFNEQQVLEYLQKLPFTLQKFIFNSYGIIIEEEEIWNYSEYLHNQI